MTFTPANSKDGIEKADGDSERPAQLSARLRSRTPARVGLRRAGVTIATTELLDFQLAHAQARDAVHASLHSASLIAELLQLGPMWGAPDAAAPILLHSAARDRRTYLERPDLGRSLTDESRQRLAQSRCDTRYDVALVIADGLSALAVERHAVAVLKQLLPALTRLPGGIQVAPLCLVEQGRVAIGDEIAQKLNASLVVVLIGERPGLSSPDSLGAYITWQPRAGQTTDAERNCISNIRLEGLSYELAAARLLFYIREATRRRLTGVALKDPDSVQRSLPDEIPSGD